MTKVNLNIELSFNDERLNENGLTVDDVTKQLCMYEDDVVDGYTITRNTSDNDDNFYINDAQIKDMHTQEMQLQRLEDMLNANLELLSDELKGANFIYSIIELNMISTVTEITSIIFASKELTGLSVKVIDEKILSKYNLTFDTLLKIENKLYNRL